MLAVMPRPATDWAAVVERIDAGDRVALHELTRLITGFLAGWNAFDFRDDWDDVAQVVITSAVRAVREDRIRDRAAIVGFIRNATRFEFIDRLKARRRMAVDERLPWEDQLEIGLAASNTPDPALSRDLEQALRGLPARRRDAVVAVHVEGRSYEEAAEALGVSLGTLKRELREGLGALKRRLSQGVRKKRTDRRRARGFIEEKGGPA